MSGTGREQVSAGQDVPTPALTLDARHDALDNASTMMREHASIPVAGLVGGIGSGKSLAAEEFAALGCAVISGDRVGHAVLQQPDIRAQIRQRWGDAVFDADGMVNRKALGGIVFQDGQAMDDLEAMLHPRIGAEITRRIRDLKEQADVKAIILDAAVMFEAGWDHICDTVVFVDAPRSIRLCRVQEKRGWTEKDLALRESRQFPLDKKRNRCSYTLYNDSGVPHLRKQIRRIFPLILTSR